MGGGGYIGGAVHMRYRILEVATLLVRYAGVMGDTVHVVNCWYGTLVIRYAAGAVQ